MPLLVTLTAADPASPATGALGIDLTLDARKPPALHDRIGWIDFAAGGSSYYYSRTSMAAAGSVIVDGTAVQVTEHDLRDALEEALSGRAVSKPESTAVGCYIPELKALNR